MNQIQNYYLEALKEAPTLAKLIDPLLRKAGFDTEDINSVHEEYEIQTEKAAIEIDRCLKKSGKPVILLQAKPIGRRDLFKVDYDKTFSAALQSSISFCVFTDGICWEFYTLDHQVLQSRNPELVKRVEILYEPLKVEEIVCTLKQIVEKYEN